MNGTLKICVIKRKRNGMLTLLIVSCHKRYLMWLIFTSTAFYLVMLFFLVLCIKSCKFKTENLTVKDIQQELSGGKRKKETIANRLSFLWHLIINLVLFPTHLLILLYSGNIKDKKQG